MSTDTKIVDLQKTSDSVLTANLKVLQALSQMSNNQGILHKQVLKAINDASLQDEWKQLLLSTIEQRNQEDETTDALTTLTSVVQAQQGHIAQLTTVLNELVGQNKKLEERVEEMSDTFSTHTARLNALAIVLAKQSGDEGLHNIFQ